MKNIDKRLQKSLHKIINSIKGENWRAPKGTN